MRRGGLQLEHERRERRRLTAAQRAGSVPGHPGLDVRLQRRLVGQGLQRAGAAQRGRVADVEHIIVLERNRHNPGAARLVTLKTALMTFRKRRLRLGEPAARFAVTDRAAPRKKVLTRFVSRASYGSFRCSHRFRRRHPERQQYGNG